MHAQAVAYRKHTNTEHEGKPLPCEFIIAGRVACDRKRQNAHKSLWRDWLMGTTWLRRGAHASSSLWLTGVRTHRIHMRWPKPVLRMGVEPWPVHPFCPHTHTSDVPVKTLRWVCIFVCSVPHALFSCTHTRFVWHKAFLVCSLSFKWDVRPLCWI